MTVEHGQQFRIRLTVLLSITLVVGDGEQIQFWSDYWLKDTSIKPFALTPQFWSVGNDIR